MAAETGGVPSQRPRGLSVSQWRRLTRLAAWASRNPDDPDAHYTVLATPDARGRFGLVKMLRPRPLNTPPRQGVLFPDDDRNGESAG